MEQLEQQKLVINKYVFLCNLLDGTQYIIVKRGEEFIPLFLKSNILELIRDIKNMEDGVSLLDLDEKEREVMNILLKCGIACHREDKNVEVDLQGDFSSQYEKLYKRAYLSRTPLQAKIELTYQCNYRCQYCYVENVKGVRLSFEEINKILVELRSNGVYKLFLTGGEPFLYPNMMDIILLASQLGFYTIIQTNASFLDEEKVKRLSEIDNIEFGISFHSSDEETFDKFTQIKGSYQRTLQAGELLKKYGVPFYYKLAVTKVNQERVEKDIKFFEENAYRFQVFTQIFPDVMNQSDRAEFCLDDKYLVWLYDRGYLSFQPSTCSAARTKLWISSSGEVYPCELVRESMGNLITDSFEEVWFSDAATEILSSDIYREPDQCKKCDKQAYCNKCLAYLRYDKWSKGLSCFCKTASIIKNSQYELGIKEG